jgi:hypothetical protein
MHAAQLDEDPAAPMLAALARAPMGEPLTPEQRAECDQIMAEVVAGRMQLTRHEDLPAALEATYRAEHGDVQFSDE